MKKLVITGLCLLLGGSIMADVFYLHADMLGNSNPNDKTLWFDDPVGGTSQDVLGAPTGGNRFDLNGKLLRSATTTLTGSHTFSGTFVVGNSTTGLLYAANWSIYGMDVNAKMMMRAALAAPNSIVISNLVLGSSGDMFFRTLTGVNSTVNLSVANISGSGHLRFGDTGYANDTNGVWSLSVTDTTPTFTGTIDLTRGQLTFANSFVLGDATFAINSAQTNRVVLANNVSFSNVTFGANSLAEGTYTASELNTAFSTDRFSGMGTMTVVPEPATIGMLGLGALSTLMLRRMSRV